MDTQEISIYVMGAGRNLKKIGAAKDPSQRIKWVQTGNGHRVSLLYSRPVAKEFASAVERRVHWLLREFRAHGEWFAVTATTARRAVDRAISEGGVGEKETFSVGRPPMNVKPTLVRLPEGIDKRIDSVLEAKEKRADLIREAIERELKRRERAQGRQ